MTLKKRGLGKGLDALLSNSHAASKNTLTKLMLSIKKKSLSISI